MGDIAISRLAWLRLTPTLAASVGLLAVVVFDPRCAVAEPAAPPAPFESRSAATSPIGKPSDAAASVAEDAPAVILPARSADSPPGYRAVLETEARREGLAPEIAEAVMAVESGYNPAAIGAAGEIGLMQILPSTARILGFVGTDSDLAVPATNIHYGVTYLAQAWRLAGGDLCTAVMKYRAGHGETRFSFRSVDYCLAVRAKLLARGFKVTGAVPLATFGEAGGGCLKCGGRSRIGRIGHVDLAALNSRLSALVVQVRGSH